MDSWSSPPGYCSLPYSWAALGLSPSLWSYDFPKMLIFIFLGLSGLVLCPSSVLLEMPVGGGLWPGLCLTGPT